MTIKIGIIADDYHLKKKLPVFLKYLKERAEISLYVEEEYIFNNSNIHFDEDIFFVKSKGDLTLALVKSIEKEFSIPVINSYKGIWYAMHRFMHSILAKSNNIPIPDFTLNPRQISPNFKDYIAKNIIDQKNYGFSPKIEKLKGTGNIRVYDKRALIEADGPKEEYKFLYYQEFIKSKWEYKVYGIGDQLLFYKQLPLLVNPNKMDSRRQIAKIPLLEERAYKAMEIFDLKLTSIDFLKSKSGQFFLTDINSTPNFNYIKNGPKIVGDFLIDQVKN